MGGIWDLLCSGPLAVRRRFTCGCLTPSERRAVSLETENTASVVPRPASEPPSTHQRGSRLVGYLLVAVGTLLLVLTAGQALAGTATGGWNEGVLRGTAGEDRLSGLGGDDEVWGLAGTDLLSGRGGDDELYGGSGGDVIVGGAGDDFIEARDGTRDYVECGAGADVASVDAQDLVAPACELVYPG